MDQTTSTVLAANEIMHITGPGAVQIASSNTVSIATVKAGIVAKSGVTTGILTSSLTPIVGLAVMVVGLVLMTQIAGKYADSKNESCPSQF